MSDRFVELLSAALILQEQKCELSRSPPEPVYFVELLGIIASLALTVLTDTCNGIASQRQSTTA